MRIIALPDLHEAITHLEGISQQLASVDLVLLVGDLTNSGSVVNVSRVINAVRQYNSSILAVPGNWDKVEVDGYLSQIGINLHHRHIVMDGIAFVGVGAALYSPNRSPNEVSENDLKAFLEEAISGLDNSLPKILVCHQPPIQSLVDKTWSGLHIGSETIRTFIHETQPLLCFSGHVHEGVGIDSIGRTQVINPGPIWEDRYAYAEIVDQQIVALEIRSC
ncbi:MAG: metallophosphoesterase family protein [Chloroflexi bacterium]|nr:metallophosphoesterase family protein [Chloroflexota bacterium]